MVKMNGIGSAVVIALMMGAQAVSTMLFQDTISDRSLSGKLQLTVGLNLFFVTVEALVLVFTFIRNIEKGLNFHCSANRLALVHGALACSVLSATVLLVILPTPDLGWSAFGLVGLNVLAWLLLNLSRS